MEEELLKKNNRNIYLCKTNKKKPPRKTKKTSLVPCETPVTDVRITSHREKSCCIV